MGALCRMRWIRVALVLACALLLLVIARRTQQDLEVVDVEEMLLTGEAAQADLLTRVELMRKGSTGAQTTWVFERRGDVWLQVEPFEHPVDPWAMRKFVTLASTLDIVRRETSTPASLNALSLASPAGVLTLHRGADVTTLEFGKRGLAGKGFLRHQSASVGGDDILVVDAELHHRALGIDPREWRLRSLFPDATNAMSVRFDGGALPLELAKQGNAWTLEAPARTRADQQQVEDFLAAAARVESSGFVADTPAQLAMYGLDPPSATLEVRSPTQTRKLLIGDPIAIGSQDRFGIIEGVPSVLRLSATTLAGVRPRFELLVSPLASSVRAADITSIEVLQSKDGRVDSLQLLRSLDGWSASTATEVKRDAIESLIAVCTESRAQSLAADAAPASDVVATVVFRGVGGITLGALIVSRDPASGAWGLDDGSRVRRVYAASTVMPLTAAELLQSK